MRKFFCGITIVLSVFSFMLVSAEVEIKPPNGDTGYLVAVNASEHVHSYDSEWTWENGHHFHKCVAVGECEQPQSNKGECEENNGITIRAATMEEDGTRIFLCKVCGHQLRTEVLPKLQDEDDIEDEVDTSDEVGRELHEFTDVSVDSVFHDPIMYVATRGIMDEMDTQQFGIRKYMTRGMLVDSLYKLADSPVVVYSNLFTDVPVDHEYADAIEWCASRNIITGYYDNTFRATDNLTRQQLCALLYRYAMQTGLNTDGRIELSDFKDGSKVSEYSLDAMSWCVSNKIIQGNDGFLMPTGTATRGQMAAILQRFCLAFDV